MCDQHKCDRCGEVTQRTHNQDDSNRWDAWDKDDNPKRVCEKCHCAVNGFEFSFEPEFWASGQVEVSPF